MDYCVRVHRVECLSFFGIEHAFFVRFLENSYICIIKKNVDISRMYHNMKSFAAKFLMVLACCIIMLHAVVPHHHHDCCGESGFVFESEVSCGCNCDDPVCEEHHCHHHDGESHHPLNHCKLQDLLSHLIIGHKLDETYLALKTVCVLDLCGLCGFTEDFSFSIYDFGCELIPLAPDVPLHSLEVQRGIGLRAPPMC